MQDVRTIIAYPSIRTDITSESSHSEDSEEIFSERIVSSRVLLQENLHFYSDDILQALVEAELVCIRLHTSDQERLRLLIVVFRYVGNNPQSEDLLAVKCGNQTN